jgi:hypothetical protein
VRDVGARNLWMRLGNCAQFSEMLEAGCLQRFKVTAVGGIKPNPKPVIALYPILGEFGLISGKLPIVAGEASLAAHTLWRDGLALDPLEDRDAGEGAAMSTHADELP